MTEGCTTIPDTENTREQVSNGMQAANNAGYNVVLQILNLNYQELFLVAKLFVFLVVMKIFQEC